MHIILFDDDSRNHLLPFTHTRPVADIRCGILSMRQRWESYLQTSTSTLTEEYLQPAFPLQFDTENTYVNASLFCTAELTQAITNLAPESALTQEGLLIACKTAEQALTAEDLQNVALQLPGVTFQGFIHRLQKVWDIFSLNGQVIKEDFQFLTKGRQSQELPAYVTAINPENIFVEPGANIYPCIINASAGPVYIGKDAEIMDGSIIRGPFALCEHATLKMGTKVYGSTTIGPDCKVGGEVSNVVFFANSNKGHDGFLGNAVIGEWCNLGADTNCSNLKNNYDEVKIWSEYQNKSVKTGLQFCGLLMGDHSKCGINTMFNTGTVAGVSCNIYGGGFPDKFIPSFSWGGSESMTTYQIEKAIDTANRMMIRRNKSLSHAEIEILHHIFEASKNQRELLH
jgi:UDP-N-acetylglucosamine diphosphorylase/glucosamine-1-phosphate N-acetyltransferase